MNRGYWKSKEEYVNYKYVSEAQIYIEHYFNFLNYSVLIEYSDFPFKWDGEWYEGNHTTSNNWRKICTSLAAKYSGIGVYHSNMTEAKGGLNKPHVHLLLNVPISEQRDFDACLYSRKLRVDKKNKFHIVPNNRKVKITSNEDFLNSVRNVRDWKAYLRYLLGEKRRNPPEVIWFRGQNLITQSNSVPILPAPLSKPWNKLSHRPKS